MSDEIKKVENEAPKDDSVTALSEQALEADGGWDAHGWISGLARSHAGVRHWDAPQGKRPQPSESI